MKPHPHLFVAAVIAAIVLPRVSCCNDAEAADADSRPNVVLFLSDDHRAGFLSCAGHPVVQTPVIDSLAARGVRFENAFVTTSICAASRATILTGTWERRHGYTFGTPPIPADLLAGSYPALLKEAGYYTGFVGKFGVGVPNGWQARMFDSFMPLNRNPYFKEQPDGTLRHLTNIEGDRAIEFLESCPDDRPFCLSVSFNAAHAEDSDHVNHFPWCPEEDGLYDDVEIPPPTVSIDFWEMLPEFLRDSIHRDRWFWRWDTPEKYQHNSRAYFRMITGLDRNIGRVLQALEESGRGDNTVVIFTGDNGYYQASRGFAGKWTHYEESLRVPLVIYDPRLPEQLRGRVVSQMVLNVDLAPTIATLALGEAAPSHQGVDLSPLIAGEAPESWRDGFFCEHLMEHDRIPKWEGVRGSRYVYARYFEHLPEGEFLHDLEADPLELINLASDPAHAEALGEMRRICDECRDALDTN